MDEKGEHRRSQVGEKGVKKKKDREEKEKEEAG